MKALLLALLAAHTAQAGTVYVATKEFPWEWGAAPVDYEGGTEKIRGWLEAKAHPKLIDAARPLRKETIRYHGLEKTQEVKFAVLGAPRSSSGHDPVFYAWIEWVAESKFAFDLADRRWERKAGVAKVAIEGSGEKNLEIRDWYWEKDLSEAELDKVFPWDAAVVAKKMLDFHHSRPRVLREKANGPGKHSLY